MAFFKALKYHGDFSSILILKRQLKLIGKERCQKRNSLATAAQIARMSNCSESIFVHCHGLGPKFLSTIFKIHQKKKKKE